MVSSAKESLSGLGISSGDRALRNSQLNLLLQGVLSVVFPQSLEVRLSGDLGTHLMREHEIFLLDNLRGEHVDLLPLSLEFSSALFSGGVNTEDDVLGLVGIVERVKLLLHVVNMTIVSKPVDLGLLVEEKSGAQTLSKVLQSEPFDGISLNTLTDELHGGGLSMEIVEGVLPCLSGVSINLPAASLLGGSPLRDFETLEESSGSSVELDLSNTFSQSIRVEILSINMVHVIGLLMELIHVEILDSDTNLAGLLNMESIGDKGNIRVEEPNNISDSGLNLVSRVEEHFNPSVNS